MKIIGTQEELKWVRRALANNCEGCIFEERCNQNASEELKKHGKTLTSCENLCKTDHVCQRGGNKNHKIGYLYRYCIPYIV